MAVCFLVSSASAAIQGAFAQKTDSPTSAMSRSDIASAKLTLRPEAKFSYTITDGGNENTVACFTDESIGDIVSWLWRIESRFYTSYGQPEVRATSTRQKPPCYAFSNLVKEWHRVTLTVTDRNGLTSTTSKRVPKYSPYT